MSNSVGGQLVWFDDPITRRKFQTPLRTVPALFATLSPCEKVSASVEFDEPFDLGTDSGPMVELHGEEITRLSGVLDRQAADRYNAAIMIPSAPPLLTGLQALPPSTAR